MMRLACAVVAAVMVFCCSAARADEGMWTFHGFPIAKANATLKTNIDQAWLDRVRQSTVRLANCTASFVSDEGLMLTNHHCVESCLAELSSKEKSLVEEGFLAKTHDEEKHCQTQVADVLIGMEEITAKVDAAIAGKDETTANDVRKATLTQLESACEKQATQKVPDGHVVSRRSVLALQVQALHRRAYRVCARGEHRRLRRRSG